ncbi:hypothetical protein BCR42DRAFT_423458 [Absidia repens]|uniref:Uncharacterized protein n=1 Tax=Absidia repens TaxID=90262 RepID=A0A1X2I531_9FUNG|nr:hypothetical protein BCR42DRAFT_423458 [Absidia repens]
MSNTISVFQTSVIHSLSICCLTLFFLFTSFFYFGHSPCIILAIHISLAQPFPPQYISTVIFIILLLFIHTFSHLTVSIFFLSKVYCVC